MKSKLFTLSVLLLFFANTFAQDTKLSDYVDPRLIPKDWDESLSALPAPTEW